MTSTTLAAAVPVHHVEDGPADGPAVVLSHSLGTDLHVWRPQVEQLARSRRVVRYDHRGHGRSPVPPGPYTIADLGRDVLALLDRLEIERTSFVGTSMGGMVGLWLAANAPDRIDRLVVCCTSAALGNPDAWTDRAGIVRSNGAVAIADGTVHRWLSGTFAVEHPDVIDRLVARFVGTTDEGYAACCEAIGAMDLLDDLARITAPTLVVAGRDDVAIPLDHASTVADGIADADLAIVGDAGHLASLEQPETITELVERHLSGSHHDQA